MKVEKYDFKGYCTKNNIKCADGRTIRKDAFKECDGQKVPLVWNHLHNSPDNVIGYAILENRDEGVYAYGYFNDSDNGKYAKTAVNHGDISAMSIYANQLKEIKGDVLHGKIREVSLVYSGANPGAFIDTVISHGEDSDDEAIIYTGENFELFHSTESNKEGETMEDKKDVKESVVEHKDNTDSNKEKTIGDIFNTLTEEQKNAVYAIIGQVVEDSKKDVSHSDDTKKDVSHSDDTKKDDKNIKHSDEKEGANEMKHNIFDGETSVKENVISHSDMTAIINDAKRFGSMKESALQHGITNISYLFPEDKVVSNTPDWVKRDTTWVDYFMNSVKHTPFSRIKSRYADITEDDARAKGYIKENMKKEEFFTLAKRSTEPTTVYKKQKIDRDDVIDITDFDVVAWLKGEMRGMLDEEIARAALVSDGRDSASDDKIPEDHIRPIWTDSDVYAVKKLQTIGASDTADKTAHDFIRLVIKSHKDYKGSGSPTLFITEDFLSDCLLMEDNQGRIVYDSIEKLATALRVRKIQSVPVMENCTRTVSGATHTLRAIMVNPSDYTIGADKGGAVNMFDDFDIDYNAQKYLIETRCSGALTKPYSAIVFESKPAN